MKEIVRIAIAFAYAGLAAACSSPVDLTQADFEGVIASHSAVPAGSLVLDVNATVSAGFETKRLVVPSDADIFVRSATGETRRGSREDLVEGARIRVRTTGTEERSIPPSYQASWIEVLPSPS